MAPTGMLVLAAVGFVVLRGCRLVAVLQRNCCLEPRAPVITTITVIVFADDDGYLHEDVAGGAHSWRRPQCPGHNPDLWQQGLGDTLLSCQTVGGWFSALFCFPPG